MTPLTGTEIPTVYDQWISFRDHSSDQILQNEETFLVGSNRKIVVPCPTNCPVRRTNFVLFGYASLKPDKTGPVAELHITNIYVLGGKLECHGVTVIAKRVIQLTKPQFAEALSTLFVQSSFFKPRNYEPPASRFTRNVFQLATDTPLETLHAYKGLRTAAKDGEEDYVKLFIAAKADVNEGNQNTPMTLAAEHKHVAIVDLLIQAKANLEKTDVAGSTPLMRAAAHNAVETAQLLLTAKADVNARNFAKQTPVDAAFNANALETLNLFYDSGVNLNTTPLNANSMSAAVMHAVANGLEQKMKDLLATKGFNIEAKNSNNDTALTLAAKYGQDQIVALLLANFADTEVQGAKGTAIEQAVFYDYPKVIALLIAEDPATAIKLLMEHSDPEMIAEIFLKSTPDPIAFGRQALKEAVRKEKKRVVEALIKAGVGVSGDPSNIKERAFGEELLLHAVYLANCEIVELLINANANVHFVDSQGTTLLMQVRLQEKGLSLLPNTKEDKRPRKFRARIENYKQIIKLLVAAGVADRAEAIMVQSPSTSQKPKKTVTFADPFLTKEDVDFEFVASAADGIEAYIALLEIDVLMKKRNYGLSCTEHLILRERIRNNEHIDLEDTTIDNCIALLEATNKSLPRKDPLPSGARKKPIIQEQKDYT